MVILRDWGMDRDRLWFLMEFVPGGSLGDWLDSLNAPIAIPVALSLIMQILEVLHYLHHVTLSPTPSEKSEVKGIVHRDIKPNNILFCDGNRNSIKICDFGLAKAYELAGYTSVTHSGRSGEAMNTSREVR